ncbi:sensor histidine kinase [Anaeromicropila herbilytica]|uniref:histidine kinase n=1 Tax=Anaeromicropila herbilytica TaxID=2785025 RepID=A0A7R7ICC2_9FIRM|nr:HAMP domain-containing sensor histidine kinase [Anaeromicropila herbilytica]BCN29721.1 two-component sensor histidine kinase [Anaeromicropila herbilytica]
MDIRRKKSLRNIFIRYMVTFILSTIMLVLMYYLIFFYSIQFKIMLPANYTEQKLEQMRDIIQEAKVVTKDMIPEDCIYGVYDKSGRMLNGSFNKNEAKVVWRLVQSDQNVSGWNHYYKVYQRENQVCVVKYSLKMKFTNRFLRRYIANPDLLLIGSFLFLFIIEVIILSSRFGKRFSIEMKKLMRVTEEIQNQNLEFQTEESDIIEINEVIESLNQMKSALSKSLDQQWNMEQTRKNQIAALAHDIKTPLTIIKGNAELNQELSSDETQIKCNNYILKSSEEIEKYIRMLIDINKSDEIMILNQVKIELINFILKLEEKAKALVLDKEIEIYVNVQNSSLPEYFYGDEELLFRAILNVIANAIEQCNPNEYYRNNDSNLESKYTSEKVHKGMIFLTVCGYHNDIIFIVEDNGKGFSEADLRLATNQFYSGDKSRNSKDHYGIGLYITKSFVALHHGSVELSNSIEHKGAKVRISIPHKHA